MASYNFKNSTKLYIVYGGNRYSLDIYPDVSFSQTFNETPIEVKTLHNQYNMFDKAVITKANPANFNFTIPLLREADLKVVFDLLIDYDSSSTEVTLKSCDLYVVTDTEVYELSKAVFENGIFQIVKDRFISLAVTGTASKLSKYLSALPGTPVARSSNRTFVVPHSLDIQIAEVTQTSVSSISMELKNDVQWLDYDTLHNSLVITGFSDTMYPEAFVVSKRTLSGSVQTYITDENRDTVTSWAVGIPLRVRAGASIGTYLLDFNLPSVVYTNRLDLQDLYMQSFDYRLIDSPTSLSQIITLNTI